MVNLKSQFLMEIILIGAFFVHMSQGKIICS